MATEVEKAARDELDALLSALVQFITGGEFIEAVLKSDVLQTYFVERQSKGADTASLLAVMAAAIELEKALRTDGADWTKPIKALQSALNKANSSPA